MDIPDAGYRHIGKCQSLESLVLMYCRETSDAATEQVTGLPHLRKYFASYTRITDRTPELLSTMHDPRNKTEIRMVRAANGQADYKVPDGRYGVGKHQLLRLDCNTGRPLGIVEE